MLTLSNRELTVAINPLGAELWSLRTDAGEWLWQGNPDFWASRAPVLFPVVGRSPGGTVAVAGQSFAMPGHGIARASLFETVASTGTSCTLRLEDAAQTRVSYPYAFRLDLAFALSGSSLGMTAVTTNAGDVTLPCSIGFHPGFAWPLPGGEGRVHLVELGAGLEPSTRRLDAAGMLLPGREPSIFADGRAAADPSLFVRDAVIIDEDWGGVVTFGPRGGPSVRVVAEGFPYLGLWSRGSARFLCLEPWHGMAPLAGRGNALDERPGIMLLPPGASWTVGMTIALSPERTAS